MVRLNLIPILLVKVGLLFLCTNAVLVNNMLSSSWHGVAFYISVKREAIQKKLDAFHNSVSSTCNDGPRLFIPEASVLPDLHYRDSHPVYIDIGYLTSYDFEEYLEENPNPCVSVSGLEVAVAIPLLAGSPTEPPVYALALSTFHERSRGDVPKINALYPHIPVDEITLKDYGAVVRNGSDEMRISFSRPKHPCTPSTLIVKEEFANFTHSDFQFGLPAPDFSFCERHFFENEYCANARRLQCDIHRYAPNICQIWMPSNTETCMTTVEIENITSGFRDFILIGDDPINILASEIFYDMKATVGLKYPCQE